MSKFLFISILLLTSCSSYNVKNDVNFTFNNTINDINFSDEMSFEEFRIQLEEYAKNNPYPKIDG